MPDLRVNLPQDAVDRLRFASRLMGVSESEVVTRLIDTLTEPPPAEELGQDLDPVPVHVVYEGQRVEGRYDPATGSLTIDSEPWSGERFGSASGAAKSVVRHFNPTVKSANRSGFAFWRVSRTGRKLGSMRQR